MVRKIRRTRRRRQQARLRSVPPRIARPSYADSGTPPPRRGVTVNSPEGVERIRAACRLAREVLDRVLEAAGPGVSTDELDELAHRLSVEAGAYPSPLNYGGFTRSLCTSVNEVVCHGVPSDRVLIDGDIVNCDVTVYLDGVHGDCSETVFVGPVDGAARRLVETTYECLLAGIEAVQPGRPISDIGRAIESIAHARGFSVVEAFAGHGIGEHFHMDPTVPHYFDATAITVMRPGMVFTVEPMLNEGGHECTVLADGWTAVTVDGGRSAQFEHTLLVTEDGAEPLTAGDASPRFRCTTSAPDGRGAAKPGG